MGIVLASEGVNRLDWVQCKSPGPMPDQGFAPTPPSALLTLPNIISFARLCAVPLAIWLVLHRNYTNAFGLFVAAGFSDAVDGWLARRNGGTALGAALDPLADKTLMIGMYVTLAATGQLPDWLAILVVFRDVVIVGGVVLLWLTGHPATIRADAHFQGEHWAADRAGRPGSGPRCGRLCRGLSAHRHDLAGRHQHAAVGGRLCAADGGAAGARMNDMLPDELPVSDATHKTNTAAWQPHLPPSTSATRSQRIALLVGIGVCLWVGLRLFEPILMPFVAAAGIAYVLDPICTRMSRVKLPRGLASLFLVLGLVTAVLLFALLLYPLILDQVSLLVGRVPSYVRGLSAFAAKTISQLQQHLGPEYVDAKLSELVSGQAGAMLGFVATAVSQIVGGGYALFNVLSLMVVTPVVAFYLLRDWPSVVARFDSWLPRRYQGVLRAQIREVDRILSAWVRGQAMCCMILAIFYALGLSLVGLELGLVVGLTAGFLSFIPYVGSITGLVVAIGLAFAQFPTWEGVIRVASVFVVGQVLEGYVIYPRFLGDRVELPAVWVIFALFAGGAAFGFVGVMLAVPVAATVGVLARFWLRRYLRSPLYLDPPL